MFICADRPISNAAGVETPSKHPGEPRSRGSIPITRKAPRLFVRPATGRGRGAAGRAAAGGSSGGSAHRGWGAGGAPPRAARRDGGLGRAPYCWCARPPPLLWGGRTRGDKRPPCPRHGKPQGRGGLCVGVVGTRAAPSPGLPAASCQRAGRGGAEPGPPLPAPSPQRSCRRQRNHRPRHPPGPPGAAIGRPAPQLLSGSPGGDGGGPRGSQGAGRGAAAEPPRPASRGGGGAGPGRSALPAVSRRGGLRGRPRILARRAGVHGRHPTETASGGLRRCPGGK